MEIAERIKKVAPSATLTITSKAKKMKAAGIDVISFGAGEPDFDTPEHIKQAAVDALKAGFTKYTPTTGIPELKEAICEKFRGDNNISYDPSQIVVSCGAKHSIYNAVQVLCQEGDEVLIPSPYWVSYPEMVKLAGATPVIVKTSQENNFKLTKELLESAVTPRARMLILNSPSNPTGCVYKKKEIETVVEIVLRHKIILLSDEIYEKLIYDTADGYLSPASLGKDVYEATVTVNGPSKTYSMTGWRIGYLAGPKNVIQAISNLQDHSTSNPTSISQKACLAALKGDQSCVEKMKLEFGKRRDYMVKRLNSIGGFRCVKPGGAFYAFPDVSSLKTGSLKLAEDLLEKAHVAVIPGEGFGWDTHIRLSFATSMENITKGLDRIEKYVIPSKIKPSEKFG